MALIKSKFKETGSKSLWINQPRRFSGAQYSEIVQELKINGYTISLIMDNLNTSDFFFSLINPYFHVANILTEEEFKNKFNYN